MEIFVYIQMGGKISCITIIPLPIAVGGAAPSLDAVRHSFRAFRGEKSECFLEEDREKLLGVIESSFGDFKQFNKAVRDVFERQTKRETGWLRGSSWFGTTTRDVVGGGLQGLSRASRAAEERASASATNARGDGLSRIASGDAKWEAEEVEAV